MIETAHYLGQEGDRVFSVLHEPATSNGRGVVVCAPLGEEMLWSRRVLVTFARELAGQGYTVLRFDYRGEGDSERWFEDTGVTSRVHDASLAVDALRTMAPGVGDMTLVGLRFGASIAAATSAERKDIDRLVLWDPVMTGADYMQGVLRLNLMYQMALHRKVVENREQLVTRLREGRTVNIEGYELGRRLYDETCGLDLEEQLDRFDGPIQLVAILARAETSRPELESLANTKAAATYSSVIEEPFWREIKTFYQRADNLFDTTMQWLGAQF